MPFRDRADAGQKLAKVLARYRRRRPVLLALPRGGVPVAAEVARALDAPLHLLIVRKIGVPSQPELAMGAIADAIEPIIYRNESVIRDAGVSEAAFDAVKDRELAEIGRRRARYLEALPIRNLRGRTLIVIDDGIATGATMRAALATLRTAHPRQLIVAVPVGVTSVLSGLRDMADAIECLESFQSLGAIGQYYDDFEQVSDQEVIEIIGSLRSGLAPAASS